MKKLLTSIVLLTTVCLYPLASDAQLLKNIMNSVKMSGKKSQKPDTTHSKSSGQFQRDSATNAADNEVPRVRNRTSQCGFSRRFSRGDSNIQKEWWRW